MITIPTILIFGAGVSKPYGFPVGAELRGKILAFLDREDAPQFECLTELGYKTPEIRNFKEAFRYSGKESVDAFLEHRTEFIDVGKAAIALGLTDCERLEPLFDDTKLYTYLFKKLAASPSEFVDNKLSVLSYNYDRSFDQFLFTALRNSYGLGYSEAAAIVQAIPIVHLHGHLGFLPWQDEQGRAYIPDSSPETIKNASRNIKIIHEGTEHDPEYQKAHRLIQCAERIIFLGFGFNPNNVARLKLPPNSRQAIWVCTYGFTRSEMLSIRANLFVGRSFLTGGHYGEYDALTFLRQEIQL